MKDKFIKIVSDGKFNTKVLLGKEEIPKIRSIQINMSNYSFPSCVINAIMTKAEVEILQKNTKLNIQILEK
jgi:hypothetical protein